MNFERGKSFDIPLKPGKLELMIRWFFLDIRRICENENHHFKFDGIQQILAILYDSSIEKNINIGFMEEDGEWYPVSIPVITYLGAIVRQGTTQEDVLNLPIILIKFSNIYRFNAKNYFFGDGHTFKVLPEVIG